MNRSPWLALSLGLNALLLVAVLAAARRPTPPEPPAPALAPPQPMVRPLRAAPPGPEPQTLTVSVPFHWAEIESTDYPTYIANLRAVGCPEATVQDIIRADLETLFHGRVQALVDTVQGRFWELLADKSAMEKTVDEKAEELRRLEEEREALLRQLLGDAGERAGWEKEVADRQRVQTRRAELEFLAPDKVGPCLALEDAMARQRGELAEAQPPLTAEQRRDRLKALNEEHQRQLQALLSPAEYEEYRLRQSPAADLRSHLTGFAATPEELKAMVRLRDLQQTGQSPPGGERDALVKLLGQERYAEFQRAQDGRYEELYQFTRRLELPDQTAADVYELRQTAEAAVRQVRSQVGLAEDERRRLLQQIRQETEQAVAGALGGAAFKLYQDQRGSWLKELEKLKP